MTDDRPAPSRAEEADRHDEAVRVQPVTLLSVKGRIGRMRLLTYHTYSCLLIVAIAGTAAVLTTGAWGWWARGRGGDGSTIEQLAIGLWTLMVFLSLGKLVFGVVALLLLIPFTAFFIPIGIQRSHDMDWPGWTVLLAFIPLVGLVWFVKPGTPGPNRFGAPPPPNTLAVKIGAWLLPVLIVAITIASVAMESSMR